MAAAFTASSLKVDWLDQANNVLHTATLANPRAATGPL